MENVKMDKTAKPTIRNKKMTFKIKIKIYWVQMDGKKMLRGKHRKDAHINMVQNVPVQFHPTQTSKAEMYRHS